VARGADLSRREIRASRTARHLTLRLSARGSTPEPAAAHALCGIRAARATGRADPGAACHTACHASGR